MDTVDSGNIFVGSFGISDDFFSPPFTGVDGEAREAGSALAKTCLRRGYSRLWIKIMMVGIRGVASASS